MSGTQASNSAAVSGTASTPTTYPDITSLQFSYRIAQNIPRGWLSESAKYSGVANLKFQTIGSGLNYTLTDMQYALSAQRLSTETSPELDNASLDFFGPLSENQPLTALPRTPGQSDASFYQTISSRLMQEGVTRPNIIQAVQSYAGIIVKFFEPKRSADCGAYVPAPTNPWSYYEDFLAETTLDSAWQFERASTATYLGANGFLETAAYDVPRFEFDTEGRAIGFLMENGATNLLPYSIISSTNWSTINSGTITNNAGVAPDGTTTAELFIPTTANGQHTQYPSSVAITANAQVTASFYAKTAGYNVEVLFSTAAWTSSVSLSVDLQNGSIISGPTAGGAATNAVGGVESVSNGWYRIWVSAILDSTSTAAILQPEVTNGSGALSYAGDGVSGIYLWGGQIEEGDAVTSYIPTNGAIQTRASDHAIMPYTLSGGYTVLAEFDNPYASTNFQCIWGASNALTFVNGTIYIGVSGSTGYSGTTVVGTVGANEVGIAGFGSIQRNVATFDNTSCSMAVSGTASQTFTTGVLSSPQNYVTLGCTPWGSYNTTGNDVPNGHIRRFIIYPTKRTATQVQEMSALTWEPTSEVVYSCYGLAYNEAGGYGSLQLPFQSFAVLSARPTTLVPNIMGYYPPAPTLPTIPNAVGGYGVGGLSYSGSSSGAGIITIEDVYNYISSLKLAGTIIWVANITGSLSTGLGLSVNASNQLTLVNYNNWPGTTTGLSAGAVYNNNGVVTVYDYAALTPNPAAPPIYYGAITSDGLLRVGGYNLPTTAPATGSGQLWDNAGVVQVA